MKISNLVKFAAIAVAGVFFLQSPLGATPGVSRNVEQLPSKQLGKVDQTPLVKVAEHRRRGAGKRSGARRHQGARPRKARRQQGSRHRSYRRSNRQSSRRVYRSGRRRSGVQIYFGTPSYYPYYSYPSYGYPNYAYRPYRYRSTRSGGRCGYWHRRCVANWGYRNANYNGCMRYHRCR